MTLPDERYRAILWAKHFCEDLLNSQKTPRVPKNIRQQARSVLRHFPDQYHLKELADARPDIIVEKMEPLTRMVMKYEEERNDDAS